jgi:hypothetical protein
MRISICMLRSSIVKLGLSWVPLNYEKLKREDIQPIVEKNLARISGWKDRLLSYGEAHHA